MDMGLNQLPLGRWGLVTQIDSDEPLSKRLGTFGLVPGTRVCCRYRTPCGKVTALEFRGTVVALRTRDMGTIRVQAE